MESPDGEQSSQPAEVHSDLDSLPDAVLLKRFLKGRDEAAFVALVQRYENLVMGVALRQVGDRHRAEDVFQATFLVLAERAGRIRRPGSLASWLHGTARRIGLRALGQQKRQPSMHESIPEPAVDAAPLEVVQREFEQQTLDEELERLPDHLRLPLILHYLEGLTSQEVADRLGVPVTTVEGRLKKGRGELRERLIRHGIGFSVVLAALALSEKLAAASTGVTSTAAGSTLAGAAAQSALHWFHQQQLAGCSANAVRLASQEIAMISTAKIATVLVTTAALFLTAGIGGTLAWGQFGGDGFFGGPQPPSTQWVQHDIDKKAADEEVTVVPTDAFTATAMADDKQTPEPVSTLLKQLKEASHLRIDVSGALEQQSENFQDYSIPDEETVKAIIHEIGREIKRGLYADPDLRVGKLAQATFVSVKAFADAKDKRPVVSVSLTPKLIVFRIDDTTYSVKTVENELFRKLLVRELMTGTGDVASAGSGEPEQTDPTTGLVVNPETGEAGFVDPQTGTGASAGSTYSGEIMEGYDYEGMPAGAELSRNRNQILNAAQDYRSLSPSHAAIEKELEEGTFDFPDAGKSLTNLVEALSGFLGIPVHLDLATIKDDLGYDDDQEALKDLQLGRRLPGLTAGEALSFLLKTLPNAPGELDYIIRDGVLTITSAHAAREFQEVAIYEVRHLGANYPPHDVAMLIESMATDAEWEATHGEGGAIKIIPGGVVVRQTQRVHRQIRGLLKQLEQFAARTDLPQATRDPNTMRLNDDNWVPPDRSDDGGGLGGGFGGGGFF